MFLVTISISNHMFGRAISNKLPERIFENFKIARVKWGKFQNFQKPRGRFTPNIARTKHVITSFSQLCENRFFQKLCIESNTF